MNHATSLRQIEIIEAAGRLLMDKGIQGLTTKNLAQEMDFSEGALYRHFKSKEDIVVLLLQHLQSNMRERLGAIALQELSAVEKLAAIFESQFQYISRNPHFLMAILSDGLSGDNEKIHEAVMGIIHYKMKLLLELVGEAQADDAIRPELDKADVVHILVGSFRVMLLKWKMSGFQLDLPSEGTRIMNVNFKLLAS